MGHLKGGSLANLSGVGADGRQGDSEHSRFPNLSFFGGCVHSLNLSFSLILTLNEVMGDRGRKDTHLPIFDSFGIEETLSNFSGSATNCYVGIRVPRAN